MNKTLLTIALAGAAACMNAQDVTYNFFDPADCDTDGWLWLDTKEKIDKYVGFGKKIQLVDAQYEAPDPDFPGEYYTPISYSNVDLKGYNQLGEEGGEGSVTGGIVLPAASYDPDEDYWATEGGGILVAMPDCALFELYISQSLPEVKVEMSVAKEETTDYTACKYIWDDDPYYNWSTGEDEGGPVITDYAGFYLNMQEIEYDYDYGEGNPDIWAIYGPKGEPRTAYIANYTYTDEEADSTCPMYIQGIHILTYTDVSTSGVEAIAIDDVKISINGGIVSIAQPAQITVYSPSGAVVASAYGTSLDCSALKGVYLVKAGNKTVKTVF